MRQEQEVRLPAPTDHWSGRIGKYDIVRLLGKGAMGAVYLAHDPGLDRDVAVKVMLPQLADDPDQKQRFEREARAVARMTHPNVVTVFDLGYHTDGSPYIVMELLRGRDLLLTLGGGPRLSLETTIGLVLQALEGLAHAHKAGIVHRDIKPANLFVTEEGVIKIMDFGVARFTAMGITNTGVVLGTANYMSPEQVLGGPLDGRSDLFSVGCMLCELVSGRRPFEADSVMTTLFRIAHDEPAIELPVGSREAGLLPLLKRCLAKKAEERFASATELAAALQDFLRHLSLRGVAAPSPAPSLAPASVGESGGVPTVAVHASAAPVGPATPAAAAVPRLPSNPAKLFRLLRDIHVGSRSGHLHFTHGAERRSLRILAGRILHGSCDVSGEHLGDVAVRHGLLSRSDLDRALARVLGERRRLGVILAELGILDRERIEEAVGLHVREILKSAIDRAGGIHAFEEAPESTLEAGLTSKLSTGELILEATRRVQDPELVRQGLGDMSRILELSTDPLLRAQRITLAPTDGFILSRIDGTLSAREIISLIPLPPEETERSLFGLICTGSVDYRPEPTRVRPSLPAAPVRVRAEAAPVGAGKPATPNASENERGASGPAPDAAELRRIILAAHASLSGRDHFELLGLERTPSDEEVRHAHSRLARLLHPDSCRDPALADLRAEREAVFVRLAEADAILRRPSRRAAYERELEARKPRRRPPTASSAVASSVPASAAVASSAPASSDVASRAPAAADPGLSPPPTDVPEQADPVVDGQAAVRRAERLIERGKYWEAIQALEGIVPTLGPPLLQRARVALARAYMKNPKWKKQANEVLQQVINESPDCVEACVALAGLYREGQLANRAAAMYRRVLAMEPGHPGALVALASLEDKEEGRRPLSLRSLFGRT